MTGLVIDLFAGGGGASVGIEAALGRPSPCAVARFWSRVEKTDSCWLWTGGRLKRPGGAPSYGVFCVGKRRVLAHQFALELIDGPLSCGINGLHDCDNPPCVRVGLGHVKPGTQAENLADMRSRGRGYFNPFPSGAAHPNAKMDASRVLEIRALRTHAKLSLAKIGARFGLHPSTVKDIADGRTWGHVIDATSAALAA